MKISLDDQTREAYNLQQVENILKDYEDVITAKEKIIIHYLVDGVEIADLQTFLNGKQIHEINNVILVVRSAAELIRDSVISFLEYVPALQNGLKEAKDRLFAGETISQEMWLSILDGLDWTSHLLVHLSQLTDFEDNLIGEISVRWQRCLSEMETAWAVRNTILMAKILDSELIDVLEELQCCFQRYLSEKVMSR